MMIALDATPFFFSFLGVHDCSFVKERSPVLSFELEQFHRGRRKRKKQVLPIKKKMSLLLLLLLQ